MRWSVAKKIAYICCVYILYYSLAFFLFRDVTRAVSFFWIVVSVFRYICLRTPRVREKKELTDGSIYSRGTLDLRDECGVIGTTCSIYTQMMMRLWGCIHTTSSRNVKVFFFFFYFPSVHIIIRNKFFLMIIDETCIAILV